MEEWEEKLRREFRQERELREEKKRRRKYGVVSLALGAVLFSLFLYSIIALKQVDPLVFIKSVAASFAFLGFSGIMLLIVGFKEVFERGRFWNYSMILKIFGVYVCLMGLFLFAMVIYGVAFEGANPGTTFATLICAGMVLAGLKIYEKGRK